MADDYTPSTYAVRNAYSNEAVDRHRVRGERSTVRPEAAAEFDRWLAAHDAAKRAEWEAEQGEAEWEYSGVISGYRRRKAGPWLPVPDTGAES